MPEHHFETPEPVELFVEVGRGSVRVDATQTTTTTVSITGSHADDVSVQQSATGISVVGPRQGLGGLGGLLSGEPRLDVVVTLPAHSRLVTRLGSADLRVTGDLGASKLKGGSGDIAVALAAGPLVAQTGSGDISVDRSTEGAHVKLQSGSGDVVVGTLGGAASISTGSGDVRIGDAAVTTVVKTGSGDLLVDRASADTSFTTGSGDLQVREASRGRIVTKGASGEVQIGVRAGVPVWTDVHTASGRIRSTLQGAGQPAPGQDHLELRATTVSGDIVLTEV